MRRLAAVAAAVLLALGLGACGSGDEGSGNGEAAEQRAAAEQRSEELIREIEGRNADKAPTPEEREAEESTTRFYRGLGAVIGARFVNPDFNVRAGLEAAEGNEALEAICKQTSSAAREQTIAYARVSAGLADVEWTCEKAMALLVRRANANNATGRIRNAEVIGVNAEGDRATATVRFGNGPATSIPLVREDGEWKLGSSPAGGGGG